MMLPRCQQRYRSESRADDCSRLRLSWNEEAMASPRVIYEAKPGSPLLAERALYERLAAETDRRRLVERFVVPRRSGRAWPVRAGQLFRIVAVEGPQVADLNVWSLTNPRERFWASRTRQLHRAHLTTFDRLWSCLPYLRPMLTIPAHPI